MGSGAKSPAAGPDYPSFTSQVQETLKSPFMFRLNFLFNVTKSFSVYFLLFAPLSTALGLKLSEHQKIPRRLFGLFLCRKLLEEQVLKVCVFRSPDVKDLHL